MIIKMAAKDVDFMVDFKKKLGKKLIVKKIDPYEIYEGLDRASDKGPLRPAQVEILKLWYSTYKDERDVIVKLHTGQGKTLIGLLILQSRLNQDKGPAIYLCPNNNLVNQTCQQAESFGINFCVFSGRDIPDECVEGKSILITTVQKLFNGLTKFGLGTKSFKVSTFLLDDSHACIDSIKDACTINLNNETQSYWEILNLFGTELEKQGAGTYAEIRRKNYDSLLIVPYWDWQDKYKEVTGILAKYSDDKKDKKLSSLRFAWPLIKDSIKDCYCIISGEGLEITPYSMPLELFGTYAKAEHRIFMSATLSDDSFLVKGLGLLPHTIKEPLCLRNEKWSGEKMILIPSLIDDSLDRTEIVSYFAKPKLKSKLGLVALVPSFNGCLDWKKYGGVIADKDNIDLQIERLKNRDCEKALVLVNRYDGIDLPDNACRTLVIDSRPHFESLLDRYLENVRTNSEIVDTKLAQIIEQGLGRGVRGEKDYCAIILTGPELIRAIRSKSRRRFFSGQTRTQIEIGLEIANYAKDEIKKGKSPIEALKQLLVQILGRDDGWKEYYTEKMDEAVNVKYESVVLDIVNAEKQADQKYMDRNYREAADVIQRLIDTKITSEEEKGWYLQEMARYLYPLSKSDSNHYQISAHKKNHMLLKPKEGMEVTTIPTIGLKRIENLVNWIQTHGDFEELILDVDSILSDLRFGVRADHFEQALDNLARALGFIGERPDKEWKEGPDNLWKIRDNQYLLIECKSSVESDRKEIYKEETGQINNACAWFIENYGKQTFKPLMIIPTKKISKGAGFNYEVEIINKRKLDDLTSNVKRFYMEFKNLDLKDLSTSKLQEFINSHKLSVEDLISNYSEKPKI